MRLCRDLGYTLGELLDTMSSAEYVLWLALLKQEAMDDAERQVRAKAQSKAVRRR